MTGCGVLAGARRASHWVNWKSFTPASCSVGTSGSSAERTRSVTASARSAPDFTCGNAADSVGKLKSTCPESVSTSAGPPPRYGTCRMKVPVESLNISPQMWNVVPTPAEA